MALFNTLVGASDIGVLPDNFPDCRFMAKRAKGDTGTAENR
jgi:hypothetical protein